MSSLPRIARAGRAVKASKLSLASSLSRTYASRSIVSADKPEIDPLLNGYPQLPNVSRQTLPPTGWWDVAARRNLGDTLHEQEELYSMQGPDLPVVPPQVAARHFAVAVSIFVGIALSCKYALTPERPSVPREYPYDGLVKELGGLEANKAHVESEEED